MQQKDRTLRIGYMPLAHDSYWHYFPEHRETAIGWSAKYRDFLSQFGSIVETGRLVDCPERSVEARLLFQKEDVDVFVLPTVTYSTPDDIMLDLKRFRRPTIVWNTQASRGIPNDMDFDRWMMEHGVTGVPGLTNLLQREDIPYFLVSGHYSEERVRQEFTVYLEAIRAVKAIWGSRIGIFGHVYPGMIDFGYDPATFYTTFGAATVEILDARVLAAFKEADAEDVERLEGKLCADYKRDEDFEDEEFTRSVRLAVGMQKVAEELRLDAATVYCQSMWQHPEIGVVSCVGNSLFAEAGVFTTCEGDVPTALAGLMLGSLSGGESVFTEIWCNDFERDMFMMGHSGMMNLKHVPKDGKSARMSRHPWWNGCKGYGACFQVQLPAGKITLLGICPTRGGGFRMVTAIGHITDRPYVPLGTPNYFVKLEKPITEFLEEFGETGAAHHLAFAYGDWTRHVKAIAKILAVDYVKL
jgi:L-arabinose isomerase